MARVFAHTRAPLRLVHALISPSSAHRRVDRIERAVHDRWRIPAAATPTDRLDAVEERLGTDTFLVMPSVFPYAAAGLMSIAVAQRLAPADLDPVLFAEVTARSAAQRHHRDGSRAVAAGQPDRRRPRGRPVAVLDVGGGSGAGVRAGRAARRRSRRVSPTSWRRTVTAPSPRSTSACPAGATTPTHLLGVLANYLQLDDPDLAPERPVRRRRSDRGGRDRPDRPGHPPLRSGRTLARRPSCAWPWIGRGT